MSKYFDFYETPILGLVRIVRKPVVDSRGYFSRIFCTEEYEDIGFKQPVVQINNSFTKQKGTIRGMHFQYPPDSEDKIVSCIQGEILDVAVDIRKGSTTFLHWHAEVLSAKNKTSLYVPKGFAHGYQSLSEECQVYYLVSTQYSPCNEGAINPFDPSIEIDWPLDVTEISERDRRHPMLDIQFKGVVAE